MQQIVRLLSGSLSETETTEISESVIEKPVMLVYTGKFQSMEGEVDINDGHIENLAKNHNGLLARVARMASGEIPIKECPPIQLDHSVSARDTVGRLVGNLNVGEYLDGEKKCKALYGKLRVMGRENVEKVKDGRWTHVSIGADLDAGKLTELSITPFPAAPNASMLRAQTDVALSKIKVDPNRIETSEVVFVRDAAGYAVMKGRVDGKEGFFCYDDATDSLRPYMFSTAAEADQYGKTTYMAAKFSQGEGDMKEKMKKYLMEEKKMSEEDAEKHLASLAEEDKAKLATEAGEHEKKMAADKDKEEGEKKKAEMTAAKASIVKLAGEIKTGSESVRLAQRKVSISTRLSKLRGAAKVTPAEIKKIKLSELAGKTDEALDLFFKAYEDREPQVMIGMIGDRNAQEGAEVARKQRLSAMEKSVLGDMPFLSQVSKNKRLAAGAAEEEGAEDTVNIHVDTDPHTDLWDSEMTEIEKMMDEDMARAKEMLRAYCKKMKGRMTSGATSEVTEDGEKAVEELASEMKKMQTQNEELLGLVAKLTGEAV